jgi:rubrerythrin
VLSSLASAEGGDGGELDIFDHMLQVLDDEEVKKVVRRHKDDEMRHEQLFLARMAATGVAPLPVPKSAQLLRRIDDKLGFFSRAITDRSGVVDAYLLLLVIEERALLQFGRQRRAFAAVGDRETAAVIDEVMKDEERHLRTCEAVSRRYLPDEAARQQRLTQLRALEAQSFEEVQQMMLQLFVDAGLVPGGAWGVVWRTLARVARRSAPLQPALSVG